MDGAGTSAKRVKQGKQSFKEHLFLKDFPLKLISFVVFMSLFISSLNSGSNGNCYYVGNHAEAVLVDVGISCREVENRMRRCGLSMNKVKAIFISHEHSDHIRGLEVLSRKFSIPVYISEGTLLNSRLDLQEHKVFHFRSSDVFEIGRLKITAFIKKHDAADPHSFVVEYNGIRVGVFTDLGAICSNLIAHFKLCHAAFLESNYDVEMLETGSYPYHLKKRIRGGEGHLSNDEALKLFVEHRNDQLSHLFLSHLSKENNCPKKALSLFEKHAGQTKVFIASRYEQSKVIEVTGKLIHSEIREAAPIGQMTLF